MSDYSSRPTAFPCSCHQNFYLTPSTPGIPSLVTLAILVYGAGTVQIRSNRSPGYLASGMPSASAISASCPCSQQISTFPGPAKALAAAATSVASPRAMELLGVRPRSAARGVMVSRGREREPSIRVGKTSSQVVVGVLLWTFFGFFGKDVADVILAIFSEALPKPLSSF